MSAERATPITVESSPSASSPGDSLLAASVRTASLKVSATVSIASFDLLSQLFGLVLLVQGRDQLVEVAVHDIIELVQCQVDAVVGDAALGKIIGANAFGPVPGSDLKLTRLRLLGLLLFALAGEEPRPEERERTRSVLVLRALVLAFDHDSRRQVRDANGRIGLVDMLSAGSRGAVRIDAQIRGIDLDGLDLLQLGQDGDGARGGMDAAL